MRIRANNLCKQKIVASTSISRSLNVLFRVLTTLIFLFPCCQVSGDHQYSEYWQRLNWNAWDNDLFSIFTYVDLKSNNHAKGWRSILISEQLQFKASKNVTLELHYTYTHERSVVSNSPWRWQHRLECEVNRVFHLFEKIYLETRNRLEIRRIQDIPKIQYRLRQRSQLFLPLENIGRLKSFIVSNELFYDLSNSNLTQDRFSPLIFTFATSEKTDVDVFFMIQFFLHNRTWRKSMIFGSQLNF